VRRAQRPCFPHPYQEAEHAVGDVLDWHRQAFAVPHISGHLVEHALRAFFYFGHLPGIVMRWAQLDEELVEKASTGGGVSRPGRR